MENNNKTSLELVMEFHKTFGHDILPLPSLPLGLNSHFRKGFMQSELNETIKATDEHNLVELADGLGDMQYVLDGWFLNSGLHKHKDAIMAEIHRSNMTKLCKSQEDANETINNLEGGFNKYYTTLSPTEDGWIVYRRDDNKIMKGKDYEKPNIAAILQQQF